VLLSEGTKLNAVSGGYEVRLELHVQDDTDGGPVVVDVRGALDTGTAATLRAASRFVSSHPGVIIDLRALERMDQAGLGALVGLIRSVHESRGAVAVVTGRPSIDETLRDAGLDRSIPVVDTVDSARDALVADSHRR
jgi:anti-anti-sigma factor